MLPAYILKCLEAGFIEKEIAKKFPEDGELVALWVIFLYHNHWAIKEPLDGSYRWRITEKGKNWIAKYNFEQRVEAKDKRLHNWGVTSKS
jgi:hypothetical protein